MPQDTPPSDELPEAVVDERRTVSLVWLIPLIAVMAAVWLGYRAYQQQGPLVTIGFQTAEGLEAGKTRVRFKDVDVGVVESIELNPDLSGVIVNARLVNHVSDYLNDKTRFWVVRPRLSGGQISGLSTLLGGTFIGVDLTPDGESRREFQGLESPPIVTATDPGKTFVLRTENLGSLSIGSPLLYRGIEVGRVVGFEMREPRGVDVHIFVDTPHDKKVFPDTRFWNISGMAVSLDANGLQVKTDSLASMLLGGVAFGNPPEVATEAPAAEDTEFILYPTRDIALERRFEHRQKWRVAFEGSIRGLLPGAPVEFRGIRVGEVVRAHLELDPANQDTHIPVDIFIEPERLGVDGMDAEQLSAEATRGIWDELVANGLRAQLKSGNLLTGALYVDLDFYPDSPKQEIAWTEGKPPKLPTVPTAFDELRGLMTKLAKLPLDSMGEEFSGSLAAMRATLESTNRLLVRLDRETASELNKTLAESQKALAGLNQVLRPDSALQAQAQRALQELSAAARSFRIMADYLERHPEALIRGKGAVQQ
ncbi:PqiB family protein [Thiosocius teredinicola]|uniref:PqiB family protein n=1 Tax=Thiosocius teredinicola TaxID=1973002 RepID=UPI00099132A2